MSVLVAVASRHGATQEIAEKIGKTIHTAGFAVDVVKLTDDSEYGPRPDPAEYDAVIVGSGVYLGRWLAPARDFVEDNKQTLRAMPVWAFSSGPVGNLPDDDKKPTAPSALAGAAVEPIDYRTFGGKLEREGLGMTERILVTVIRAADEDDRDWVEITSWAELIAKTLHTRMISI